MSGYLQRLVSSARHPGGGVHPLAGSLYSEPRSEIFPAAVEEESVVKNPVTRAKPPVKENAASPAERPASNSMELPREQALEPEFKPLVESSAMPVHQHIPDERFHELHAAGAPDPVESARAQPVVRLVQPLVEAQPATAAVSPEVRQPPALFRPSIPPR